MTKIARPFEINEAFAAAFHSRDLAQLLALYEPDAALRPHHSPTTLQGREPLRQALEALTRVPGRMTSRNAFCTECGDIALLKAEWTIQADDASVIARGSSVEVARRQADGGWRYVIDRALE